jgi:hypothetical protein
MACGLLPCLLLNGGLNLQLRDNRFVVLLHPPKGRGGMMTRIKVLAALVVMLATGLGTIVVLIQIVPANADGRLPLTLTASTMVAAGLIAAGVLRGSE